MSNALSTARRVVNYIQILERRLGQMERAAKSLAVEAKELRDALKRAQLAVRDGQKD